MREVHIVLKGIEDVRNFVKEVILLDYDVDLVQGRYVVDAKSIMGIFSLDLMNPITLTAHSDNCDKIMEELKPFIVE